MRINSHMSISESYHVYRVRHDSPYEMAAMLSAAYDGHENTLGDGVGVKNADPHMQVTMSAFFVCVLPIVAD